LDKWLVKESTPRLIQNRPTYDAEALALLYPLNHELLHEYLEEYAIKPKINDLTLRKSEDVLDIFEKKLLRYKYQYKENDMDLETANFYINTWSANNHLPNIDIATFDMNDDTLSVEQKNNCIETYQVNILQLKANISAKHGALEETLAWAKSPPFLAENNYERPPIVMKQTPNHSTSKPAKNK
jgi:hypothetical protein